MSSRNPCRAWFALGVALSCLLAGRAVAVTIDMVPVGNPGNVNDPATGSLYGAVNYEYQIGKYEVTIQQYADFLNAVADTDTYSLYSPIMGSSLNIAGIARTGTSGAYTYAVTGPAGSTPAGANSAGNRPITNVSWFDAARFANWMANGQPAGPQTAATTENGAYTLSGATSGTAPARNAINPNTGVATTFWIPTENEWYKAAYYNPTLNSGSGGYYTYATRSNSAPSNTIGSGSNQANFYDNDYAVTQGVSLLSNQNYLTNVGAFTNSASFYGTFDQSGNVIEVVMTASGTSIGRGGNWSGGPGASVVASTARVPRSLTTQDDYDGFRLAAVPEPSTYAMALAGLACGGWSVWRRRRRQGGGRSPAIAVAIVLVAASLTAGPARAVTIDMVPVGNPGNANDPATGSLYGAVNYEYQIGKHEVTLQQYTDFLNAVADTDTYSLYNTSMGSFQNSAGITRSGASGAYTYAVNGPFGTNPAGANSPGNRPVTFVNWFDAARFTNWMANGQPTGLQTGTTTENGAYTLSGATSGTAPARNAINPNTGVATTFWLPTENEWYKAAYYDPTLNSGSGGYYTYATRSNSSPGNTIGSGTNQANIYAGDYAVTQSPSNVSNQNYLTNVGAFTNSASSYGTFDQSGNVWEWNDLTGTAGVNRGLRGGSFTNNAAESSSGQRSALLATSEGSGGNWGFRVAAVPEPSTYCLALAGLACGGLAMRRRRMRA